MIRRFELGPILVLAGAVLLLVSLFLDWYGPLSAWDAFEIADMLLAALALAAIAGAAGALVPELAYIERRWLPPLVLAAVVVVAVEIINPPPAATDLSTHPGAWLALAAALAMLVGTVLSYGRVSLSVAVEGRDGPQRVSAVDERQQTTETGAVVPPPGEPGGPATTGDG